MILTVYAQRNSCLIFFAVLHGTIENDASEACAIVLLCGCNGQCASRLMILWTATIYDCLQLCIAAFTIPSVKLKVTYSEYRYIAREIKTHGNFVLSSILCNWKIKLNDLRDWGVRGSSDTAARQLLFLLLCGDNDAARRYERRLRRCENSQIVILLMNIISRALCFHTTLKTSIITIIWSICNAQIVNSLLGPKFHSVKIRGNYSWETCVINIFCFGYILHLQNNNKPLMSKKRLIINQCANFVSNSNFLFFYF